jgi:hypothetical protein
MHMSDLQVPAKAASGWLDINGRLLSPFIYLFEYLRSYVEERIERFDARFGTDTAAPSFGSNARSGSHAYVPITASLLYGILGAIPLRDTGFTFVDMGSGKGRALLVASEFPFAKIVGIELSESLHQTALENTGRYKPVSQKCAAFDLRCMNAVDYDFGSDPLVLFLYDPFGRDIVQRVIDNLAASLRTTPRPAYVVYVYPLFADVIEGTGIFQKIKEGAPHLRPWSRYVIYAATVCDTQVVRPHPTLEGPLPVPGVGVAGESIA